jgi:DNA-directed RNA polymerase subunit RPC12/RpoP
VEVVGTITCPDCGGRAHVVQPPGPDDELVPGDVLTYRCEDCHDRWDVVLGDDDDPSGGGDPG